MSLNDVLDEGRLLVSKVQEPTQIEDTMFLRPRPAPKPPITPFSNLARLEASIGVEDAQEEQDMIRSNTDSECDSDSLKTDQEECVFDDDDPLQSIINAQTSQELRRALDEGQFGTTKARAAKARPPRLLIVDSADPDLCQRRSRAVPVDEHPESAMTPGRIAINDEQGKKAAMVNYDSDDALDNIILDIPSPLHPAKRQTDALQPPPKSPFRRPRQYKLPI